MFADSSPLKKDILKVVGWTFLNCANAAYVNVNQINGITQSNSTY